MKTKKEKKVENYINAIVWVLFLTWVGIACHTEVGCILGLLGGGVIVFMGQFVRLLFKLKLQIFSLIVATCLALGSLLEIHLPGSGMIITLLVLAGISMSYTSLDRTF